MRNGKASRNTKRKEIAKKMKKIHCRKHVREVRAETHYIGHMVVSGIKIDFDLSFIVPISDIANMTDAEIVGNGQRLFGLTMKKDGEPVSLNEQELCFLGIVCYKIVTQARTTNSFLKTMNKGLHDPLATDGILKVGEHPFSSLERQMFNRKFGCKLPD